VNNERNPGDGQNKGAGHCNGRDRRWRVLRETVMSQREVLRGGVMDMDPGVSQKWGLQRVDEVRRVWQQHLHRS
jgi:hypothetical protein